MNSIKCRRGALARIALAVLMGSFAACASHPPVVESGSSSTGSSGGGTDVVTYYLPKQLVAIDLERIAVPAPTGDTRGVTGSTSGTAETSPSGGMRDTLTLRLLPPVPDIQMRFYARLPHASAHGDIYTVQTTEAGLLTSTGAPAGDPSGRVLARIDVTAATATLFSTGQIGVGSAGHSTCARIEGVSVASAARPFKATVIVDPTVPSDLARAEGQLRSLGAEYRFELSQVGNSPPHVITSVSEAAEVAGAASLHPRVVNGRGLFYRRAEPYVLAIYQADPGAAGALRFVSAAEVSLPNRTRIERAMMPAVAVKASEGAQFQNGMLATRPSPVIAGIPADVWKTIIPKPRPRFQFKFSTSSSDPTALNEPAEPLDAQTEAIKAVLALKRAQEEQGKK